VRPYKIRRIKMKMAEKFSDPRKMFDAMDRDGGGSLDRKELAMGLFALGVWLAPTELQALLATLDQDGGGDIDPEEFQSFWDSYSFE
jgi:calmodulin